MYIFSLYSYVQFSHYFISLIAGCTTVVCLVDEKLAVQPTTTIGMCILKKKLKKIDLMHDHKYFD